VHGYCSSSPHGFVVAGVSRCSATRPTCSKPVAAELAVFSLTMDDEREANSNHTGIQHGDSGEDEEYAEIDPEGRYFRYAEVVGRGRFKCIYKAFDTQIGEIVIIGGPCIRSYLSCGWRNSCSHGVPCTACRDHDPVLFMGL